MGYSERPLHVPSRLAAPINDKSYARQETQGREDWWPGSCREHDPEATHGRRETCRKCPLDGGARSPQESPGPYVDGEAVTKIEVWTRYNDHGGEGLFVAAIGPWWKFAVVAVVEACASFVCRVVFIPSWIGNRVHVTRDWIEEGNPQRFSLYDWYGSHPLDGLHSDVLTWAYKQFRYREVAVPLQMLIESWGDDAPEWWRECFRTNSELAETGTERKGQ